MHLLLRQRKRSKQETESWDTSCRTDIRVLVIGKHGENSASLGQHIGSQLENVIRTLHRPILVTPSAFKAPESVMLAFDGSATTRKGVETLAASSLFKKLPAHVVMIGDNTAEHRE